jgi:hypothetical protein
MSVQHEDHHREHDGDAASPDRRESKRKEAAGIGILDSVLARLRVRRADWAQKHFLSHLGAMTGRLAAAAPMNSAGG